MLLNFRPRILWEGEGGGSGGGSGAPPATPPPATPPATDPPPAGGQPGPVPYERFKEVNDSLKAVQTELEKIKTTQKAAEEKEAADQGKWKELAEKRETELKTEKLARQRLEVASKKGIPVDLVGRLQGETVEDMEKDADTLLQFLKPASGPGVPPAGKGGSTTPLDMTKMSPKEIREKKSELWKQQTGG